MQRVVAVALGGALTFCLALSPAPAAAQGARTAALILRVLAYDRNLSERASGSVTVLVAYREGNAGAEREKSEIVRALEAIARRTTIRNRRARVVAHAYRDRRTLRAAMAAERAVGLYVCDGLGSEASAIGQEARSLSVLTMTGDPSAVRSGLSVGLIPDGSGVRVVINLRAATSEGARLDAALLRISEVIR